MFEITVEDSFSSAHQLIGYEGPCENLHGHNWKVKVRIKGKKLGRTGMLMDFKKAKQLLKEVLSDLDHKNLNELKEFKKTNPTAENIAAVIFFRIKGRLGKGTGLDSVSVWESEATCATYSS